LGFASCEPREGLHKFSELRQCAVLVLG